MKKTYYAKLKNNDTVVEEATSLDDFLSSIRFFQGITEDDILEIAIKHQLP